METRGITGLRGRRRRQNTEGFVAETNADSKPFAWTADPEKIIAAVRRGHQGFRS
jgi:hypothetical protein